MSEKSELQSESEVKERTCGNCACSLLQTAGALTQLFCRRNMPMHAVVDIETPMMRMGQPIVGKDGKPRMEMTKQDAYMYPPTLAKLVCYDGWRALGTEPGKDAGLANLMPQLLDGYKELMTAIQSEQDRAFLDHFNKDSLPQG